MTNKQRKAMIEQWVTEINPKAILRAADARDVGLCEFSPWVKTRILPVLIHTLFISQAKPFAIHLSESTK